jgi:hypothetical protein
LRGLWYLNFELKSPTRVISTIVYWYKLYRAKLATIKYVIRSHPRRSNSAEFSLTHKRSRRSRQCVRNTIWLTDTDWNEMSNNNWCSNTSEVGVVRVSFAPLCVCITICTQPTPSRNLARVKIYKLCRDLCGLAILRNVQENIPLQ